MDDKGDRSFSFYRNPGADTCLSKEEVDIELIEKCKIFHFGTLSMTHEPSLSATLKAADYAKACGKVISFDPNYRALLWSNEDNAILAMKVGLKYANIAKLSLEEAQMVTGKIVPEDCLRELLKFDLSFVAVTMGPEGCMYATNKYMVSFPEYPADVKDTTGAGYTFWGTVLYGLLNNGTDLNSITQKKLEEIILMANIAAGMSTEKKGAIPSIPDLSRVRAAFDDLSSK